MADDVRPVGPGERLTLVWMKGMGTTFMYNSRSDADGRFFATKWFVYLFPIVPLARYYVRKEGTTVSGRWSNTEYTVLGRSRLRGWELLRVYVLGWLLIPGAFVGPIVVGALQSQNEEDNSLHMLGATGVSFALLALVATGWWLCRTRRRPVREARFVDAPSPRRDRR